MFKMPAWSVKGMVVAEHPLAALAGRDALKQGGNFADATVAIGATLSVVTPHLCGLGGDFFALIWLADERKVMFLNGSGHAPQNLSAAELRRSGLRQMPTYSALTVTVPGLVDALWQLHQRFGKLPWSSLWKPAIVAAEGFAVSFKLANAIAANADRLASDEGASQIFFRDGKPLAAGKILLQPALAQTMERVAKGGRDGFYTGEVAQAMTAHLQSLGSPITVDDFFAQKSDWGEPISLRYGDLTLLEMPPNAQGITTLQSMALLKNFPFTKMSETELTALLCSIAQVTAQEREAYLADPRFVPQPPEALLHPDRIAALQKRLPVHPYSPLRLTRGDTTNFCLVDRDGNAISAIQSVFHGFGSGIVEPKTGILFQNRGSNFVLTEGHPNELLPRKRPRHTLSAVMVLDGDGNVKGMLGTSGGDYRPLIQTWLLMRWLDEGMALQEAIEAPRGLWLGEDRVLMEQGVADPTIFQQSGWQTQVIPYPGGTGVAHGIERVGESWCGCADVRGDGVALPL